MSMFVEKSLIYPTIYLLEATTTIVVTKNLNEHILDNLLNSYKKYFAVLAVFLTASPMYWIAYIFPRDNNLWVFGGYDNAFEGNAKYLFIYVNTQMKSIKAVWIAKDKSIVSTIKHLGFKSYQKNSVFSFFYTLRAGVYLYNDTYQNINIWNSSGAVRFNLWHGIPLKKIGYDIENKDVIYHDGCVKKRVFNINLYKRSDYVLSTSPFVSDIFSSAFLLSKENVLNFGYPRNVLFSKPKHEILSFIETYEPQKTKELVKKLNNYDKVLIYMPTWRDNGLDFIKASGIDFESLDAVLVKNNFLLLLKLHHHTKIQFESFNLNNIALLDNSLDVYPILPFTDILITDYSSVYFDYLLLNKEILFFCFDLDDYLCNNRKMYFDYNTFTPGKKIYNFIELLKFLQNKENIENLNYSLQRDEILKKIWSNNNNEKSLQEITRFVKIISKLKD